MFDNLIDWVKGLLGGAAEDVVQGVSGAVDGAAPDAAEAAQSYGEDTVSAATGGAEDALGGMADTTQEVHEGAGTIGETVEDPGAAATDIAGDRLPGNNE
ncbi:hypothetical protein [Allosalinactinospora lopnorensis]|uniref:hypothetical protein n=1 Tax=Allosalinactinospora lopnorensis TaxID=1352348 RepID=UPI000623CB99|nr:hypothetical protein [Allosalinactinospora lopnorensis]